MFLFNSIDTVFPEPENHGVQIFQALGPHFGSLFFKKLAHVPIEQQRFIQHNPHLMIFQDFAVSFKRFKGVIFIFNTFTAIKGS